MGECRWGPRKVPQNKKGMSLTGTAVYMKRDVLSCSTHIWKVSTRANDFFLIKEYIIKRNVNW
jgi:hypothetical protein